ncbi:hypothetical protein [Nostoc sp. UHCC 0252]|uniref:hypothetical protein n=1 Tax=Nostoc sp. UHCC 0252 TaxID=3110241 RepID=UPI002B2008C0|nr:hypothetical protein [Nostoc sp. UHCC 0252]MEA5606316.1 hypothetical protein [Nostoc sp. UHCC 0252]
MDNQDINNYSNQSKKGKATKLSIPYSVIILNLLFSICCFFLMLAGLIGVSITTKATCLLCERTPTQVICQLNNENWWESTTKKYSGEEFQNAKIERVMALEGVDGYYVSLLTNSGKVPDVFYYSLKSDAQKTRDQINNFINNSQTKSLTITQDKSKPIIFISIFCFLFGALSLSLTIYSYSSKLRNLS